MKGGHTNDAIFTQPLDTKSLLTFFNAINFVVKNCCVCISHISADFTNTESNLSIDIWIRFQQIFNFDCVSCTV